MKFAESDRRLLLLLGVVLLALLAGGSRHSAEERGAATPAQQTALELGSGVVSAGTEWSSAARRNPLWLIEISQMP